MTQEVTPIAVQNEWDPLEEVVIGRIEGARIPRADRSLHAIEFPTCRAADEIPSGPLPKQVIQETAEELESLCEQLERLGITVRRPPKRDLAGVTATPDWASDGLYDYCPRDILLTVGDMIIETPCVLRARFLEPSVYRELLLEYHEAGARWISAPKPQLRDEMYKPSAPLGERLKNLEPAFDAANVLRLGRDLLYLVSDSGNERGLSWLRSTLGPEYAVHAARGLYASTHIDSTVVPLREGLVLLNPDRVTEENLPPVFADWEKIYCPDLRETPYVGRFPRASKWIGMNLLVLNPHLAVVDERQPDLIKLLEAHKMEVLPLTLTHARTLGGGFHCVSLDVRRRSSAVPDSHGAHK